MSLEEFKMFAIVGKIFLSLYKAYFIIICNSRKAISAFDQLP